jgi:hypothetical protein
MSNAKVPTGDKLRWAEASRRPAVSPRGVLVRHSKDPPHTISIQVYIFGGKSAFFRWDKLGMLIVLD